MPGLPGRPNLIPSLLVSDKPRRTLLFCRLILVRAAGLAHPRVYNEAALFLLVLSNKSALFLELS